MRRARLACFASAMALSSLLCGCTHYHYYGQARPGTIQGVPVQALPVDGVPVCDAPVNATPTYIAPQGAICEVPPSKSVVASGEPALEPISPYVASSPGGSSTVVSRSSGQPVYVVKDPSQMAMSNSPGTYSRYRWRRPDPENFTATRVEGQVR